jgi:PAS domain S-box-containing protein
MNTGTTAASDGARRAEVITEGRRQEALLTADALQNAIFNSANFSSIATDARGVIQIFNVGAERMLGYTAAEVMNQITPADISDPQEVVARATALSLEFSTEIAPGFEALVFKASREIEDIYELTYIRKDGSRFPAVVSVTALRDELGAIIGYLLIGTDNTARKRVEAEQRKLDQLLRDQNVELNAAKVIAEKANLAKSDFLSSMSHELRSPLNGILGFAQLMESDTPPPTPRQQESIGQILQAGWHLLKLINEILDLAKVESGMLSLSPESVSLAEVMVECQALLEGQAQKRGIQITFPQPDVHLFVHADRTRLKQVLINLLSNAVKYNRALGTVEVQCAAGTPGRIRVSIRDTGVGLSPERQAQLFQPFNRLGQEASGVEGTGIGLVVAKQLIELMDGVIGVESAVGVGSTFWFELEAAAEPQFAPGSGEPDMPAPSLVPGSRPVRLLLYVEDNLANLKLVERLIERRPDLSLISAVTGARGIQLARSRRPDVILMDINLPDISGLEALVVLRTDPATALIPVIAISANAMPHDINKGRQAGFFEYLTKPIKVNEFTETLNAALALAERQSGRAPVPGALA